MAIVGSIIAMLLPAIQGAREAARKSHCQNNLKQIGIALLTYHDVHGAFPSGGWGHEWVGVPEGGAGDRQPGSWIYSLLPFIEEGPLFDLGRGRFEPQAADAYSQRLRTPISVFVCSSRRPIAPWPVDAKFAYVRLPKPLGDVSEVARSDYAINAGSSQVFSFNGPATFEEGQGEEFWRTAPIAGRISGISHLRRGAPLRSISDGASKTYLAGEKYLEVANYSTGTSLGDNESMYTGYCTDQHRFAGMIERLIVSLSPYALPLSDNASPESTVSGHVRFGSAHQSGFNMLHCDGSIHFLTFEIDGDVHFRAGHRTDAGAPLTALPYGP